MMKDTMIECRCGILVRLGDIPDHVKTYHGWHKEL